MEPTADVLLLLLLIIFLIVLFFIGHFSSGQVKVMVSLSWMMDQRFRGGPETYVRGRVFGKQQFWFLALSSSCCPNRISECDASVSLCTGLRRPTWNSPTSYLISWSMLAAFGPKVICCHLDLWESTQGRDSPPPAPAMLPKTLQLSSAVLDFDCFILVGC